MSQASSMSTDGPSNAPGHPQKSKTLATWAAVLGGPFGLHRFYLYGLNDVLGWLLPIPTLLGAWGVRRVLELGQDDHLSWVLLPLLGLTVAACMLQGIVFGLTPDERWNSRHNATLPPEQHPASGWLAVIGVVVALLVGATVLMSTIAFSGQRYFEYQIEEALKMSQ